MKIRLFCVLTWIGFIISSCTETSTIGIDMAPDEDIPSVQTDTFMISATTVKLDSIYARSIEGGLGEIYDPLYGYLKSDYLCQFYCPENFQFAHTPIDGKIDSVELRIFYNSWIGDSLVAMQAQAYAITSPLDRHFYTNIDPTDYSDMQISYGTQGYTAYDATISDSLRNLPTGNVNKYYPHVRIRMPLEFGQKLYEETITNPERFRNQQAFNEYFPGLYITTTYGTGNMLNIYDTRIVIYYDYVATTKDQNDNDSTFVSSYAEAFNATKEVIQLNRFVNSGMEDLLEPNDKYTYIKSPAGVATRIEIPIKEIAPKIEDRTVNSFPLKMRFRLKEEWEHALNPPSYVLLIPEDSIKSFFEGRQTEDKITTYLASHGTSSTDTARVYSFGNVANLLNYQMLNNPDENLAVYILPVQPVTESGYTIEVNHYLKPSGAILQKDEDNMRIEITTTTFTNK